MNRDAVLLRCRYKLVWRAVIWVARTPKKGDQSNFQLGTTLKTPGDLTELQQVSDRTGNDGSFEDRNEADCRAFRLASHSDSNEIPDEIDTELHEAKQAIVFLTHVYRLSASSWEYLLAK